VIWPQLVRLQIAATNQLAAPRPLCGAPAGTPRGVQDLRLGPRNGALQSGRAPPRLLVLRSSASRRDGRPRRKARAAQRSSTPPSRRLYDRPPHALATAGHAWSAYVLEGTVEEEHRRTLPSLGAGDGEASAGPAVFHHDSETRARSSFPRVNPSKRNARSARSRARLEGAARSARGRAAWGGGGGGGGFAAGGLRRRAPPTSTTVAGRPPAPAEVPLNLADSG